MSCLGEGWLALIPAFSPGEKEKRPQRWAEPKRASEQNAQAFRSWKKVSASKDRQGEKHEPSVSLLKITTLSSKRSPRKMMVV